MSEHRPDCQWEKTTSAECEYRDTHRYCPHPEHACTCPPKPSPTEQAYEAGRKAERQRILGLEVMRDELEVTSLAPNPQAGIEEHLNKGIRNSFRQTLREAIGDSDE